MAYGQAAGSAPDIESAMTYSPTTAEGGPAGARLLVRKRVAYSSFETLAVVRRR